MTNCMAWFALVQLTRLKLKYAEDLGNRERSGSEVTLLYLLIFINNKITFNLWPVSPDSLTLLTICFNIFYHLNVYLGFIYHMKGNIISSLNAIFAKM